MSHTTEEIMKAYAGLDEEQMLALRIYAEQRLAECSFYTDGIDLMHEALSRALEGRRHWPLGLDFGLFMALTMKSIAGHERVKGRLATSLESGSATAGLSPSAEEDCIAFEELNLARKAAERAKTALAGDEPALRVLSGMSAGMSPREICAAHGMDAKAFDAARHRVLRRLRLGANLH